MMAEVVQSVLLVMSAAEIRGRVRSLMNGLVDKFVIGMREMT